MNDVESKIRRSEEVENPKDLATCNRLLLDQQRLEDQERLEIRLSYWPINQLTATMSILSKLLKVGKSKSRSRTD